MKYIIFGGVIKICNYMSERIASSKKNNNNSYYYVSSKQEPIMIQIKCHFVYWIDSREGATIINWLSKMKLYVSVIEESYKVTTFGHLVNSGTAYLLLHIVQCWRACEVD